MKNYRDRTIAQRIATVQKAVQNVLEVPDVLAAMSKRKYNAAALNAGALLAATAATKVRHSGRLLGLQTKATGLVETAQKELRADCVEFSQICRAVYIDQPDVLAPLGLDQPVPRTREDLITAANLMFDVDEYSPELTAELLANEWGGERLSRARGRISELTTAMAAQGRAVTNAQRASEHQELALEEMDKWMAKFLKIARIVFKKDKQQLEQLGAVGRSVPTKRQRAARSIRVAKRKQAKAAMKKAA